jgi:virginiamycin B lyase
MALFHEEIESFEILRFDPPPGYPPGRAISNICDASDGSVWAGTAEGYPIRRGGGEPTFSFVQPEGPSINPAFVGCRATGEIWVFKDEKVRLYTPGGELLRELTDPAISKFHHEGETCPNGDFWMIATPAQGPRSLTRLSLAGRYDFIRSAHSNAPDWFYSDMTCASDGGAWFVLVLLYGGGGSGGGALVRVFPDGRVVEYEVPLSACNPVAVTEGPDGAAWFTELTRGVLGRVDDEGRFSFFGDRTFWLSRRALPMAFLTPRPPRFSFQAASSS